MKMKDVCVKTGLTERAVRFYADKDLIHPQKTKVNGRENWEFDEKDVEELLFIAKLRKAEFTVQDIKEMRENVDNIPGILSKHSSMIRMRHESDEQLIEELSSLQVNTNQDWKIIAKRLFKTKSIAEPNFSQFDEPYEEPEKKNYVRQIIMAAMIFFVLILGISFGIKQYKNQTVLTVASVIGDVTFHNLWIDVEYYADITTAQELDLGFSKYFHDVTTVKLEEYGHYEAVQINSTPYVSVGIKIAIPYFEAKNLDLLD